MVRGFSPRMMKNLLQPLKTTVCCYAFAECILTSREMSIAEFLIEKLKAPNPKFIYKEICKHPKKQFIKIDEVMKSLKFLQDNGFSMEVIADSVAVCFYPQENIKEGFKEIMKNEAELNTIGFVNGFLQKDSCVFPQGCTSKDKRLQLCIYYMELPFAFNGSGIFHSA